MTTATWTAAGEYTIDPLEVLFVRDVMHTDIVLFRAGTPLMDAASSFVGSHRQRRDAQHRQRLYPLLDGEDRLLGVVTRRDMLDAALGYGLASGVAGDGGGYRGACPETAAGSGPPISSIGSSWAIRWSPTPTSRCARWST